MKVYPIAWLLALAIAAPATAQVRRQVPATPPQVRPTMPAIRPPVVVPRGTVPPSTPMSTTSPVHFDQVCRDVTGLSAGWGGSFQFKCVRPDGQTEELRVARVADVTGLTIGAASENQYGAAVLDTEGARHSEAMTTASISQVVQAFMLYKSSHPDSSVLMGVRGMESMDPANPGDRVVQVAYFNLN